MKTQIQFASFALLILAFTNIGCTNNSASNIADQDTGAVNQQIVPGAAVDFVLTQKNVDSKKVFLLGHSEGTQVAIDFTTKNSAKINGVFLLGYLGVDMATISEWQLYKRDIEMWLSPDVDLNHDNTITRDEALPWPDLAWFYESELTKFTLAEYEAFLRGDSAYQKAFDQIKAAVLYQGVFSRGDIYQITADLPQQIAVFNGEKDVATPIWQVTPLKSYFDTKGKTNYSITIVPGLSHGFSQLTGTGQALLNNTMGPVDVGFVSILENAAALAIK